MLHHYRQKKLPPTPVVPVYNTEIVYIILTNSTTEVDILMANITYKAISNIFNYSIISYEAYTTFTSSVVTKGQKKPSYNEFMDIPKTIKIVLVLMISMDYGMNVSFVIK